MDLIQVFERIWKRWWLIIGLVLVCTVISTPVLTSTKYRGTITFGMSLNSDNLDRINIVDLSQAQVNISSYLTNRMQSVEVQARIAREAGLPDDGLEVGNPFYEVTNQQAGFVTLTFISDSEEDIEKFLVSSKSAYNAVVNEWNEANPTVFDVEPSQNFLESSTEVGQPFQVQLLPPFVGLTVGIILALLLPLKTSQQAMVSEVGPKRVAPTKKKTIAKKKK